MVDWKQSGFQIVASLIGSSLIVTAVSSLISDMSKPHISINLDFESAGNTTKIRNIFANNGKSPATHLRITLSYPDANIIKNSTEYRSENMTLRNENCYPKNNNCNSFIAYIPRLASGAMIILDTTVNGSISRYDFIDYSNPFYSLGSNPTNTVVATYDQGSDKYTPSESFSYGGSPFNIQLIIIPSVLALVSFAVASRYKLIKESRLKKDSAKFAYNILKDIVIAQNTLIEDRVSTKIIPFDTWKSKTCDARLKMIGDYNDYKKIDEFYAAVRRRDYNLRHNGVAIKTVKIYNEECLELANDAYNNVQWRNFNIEDTVRIDYILAVPAVILGSFFITYICEGLPLSILRGVPAILITVATRSLAAFFIIGIIIKKSQPSALYNNNITGGILTQLKSFKNRRIKLLALSAIIMGFPTQLLVYPVGYLVSYASASILGLSQEGFSSYLSNFYTINAIFLVIDIARMFTLMYVFLRHYKVKLRRLYHGLAITSALAGSIHFLTGLLFMVFFPLLNTVALSFIVVGIIQMVWTPLIIKKHSTRWHYLGLAASTLLDLVWISALVLLVSLPGIFYELRLDEHTPEDVVPYSQNYANSYYYIKGLVSSLPLIVPMGILIVIIQIIYISITTIVITEERKTKFIANNKERL
jgi:hypothetical protein